MNTCIQEVVIGVIMRSIAVGNKGHRMGREKNCEEGVPAAVQQVKDPALSL